MSDAYRPLDDVRVVVDVESLAVPGSELAVGKYITGIIAIVINGTRFPDPAWNDKVDQLLSYWNDRCRHLRSGGKTADFAFFDGPLGFLATCDGDDCAIDCYRRNGDHRQTLLSVECTLESLDSSIARCAKQVWSACVRHGWPSDLASGLEDIWRRWDDERTRRA